MVNITRFNPIEDTFDNLFRGVPMWLPVPKRLQLLKETVPHATRVAALWNPDVPWHARNVQELEAAAPGMSIELKPVAARGPADFSAAFSVAKRARVQAMYVLESANYWSHRAELLAAVSKARIPVIYGQRGFAANAGGLISYGTNFSDIFRRSAGYVDRIRAARDFREQTEQPRLVATLAVFDG